MRKINNRSAETNLEAGCSGMVSTATAHCRYLKYLTKKYLKKHNVRDWLRVIASNKDRR